MKRLQKLRDAVGLLEAQVRDGEDAGAALIAAAHPDHRDSARNFVHYVTIRQTDLRDLQLGLIRYGLSSLGRLEGHVLDALIKVGERLDDALARDPASASAPTPAPVATTLTWEDSSRLLHDHTRALLGPRPTHRHVYVMVTAPPAAEVDDAWVERLLVAGMNVLRVNTAHEDERAWAHIVATARRVAHRLDTPLRIAVDLPGPKLRTVMLQTGPRVAKWKPTRDELGQIVAPCTITLRPRAHATLVEPDVVNVPDPLWAVLAIGDVLAFRDARGKDRELTVVQRHADHATAELRATAYVVPETTMTLRRGDAVLGELRVTSVPARRFRLALAVGDRWSLLKHNAPPPPDGKAVGCTLDAALDALRIGHRVLFDDGHLEAIVEAIEADRVILRVTFAAGGAFKLAGEKGINLPDTELTLPLFSVDDEHALRFAVGHADIVDASFVRSPEDVRELHRRLAALGADRLGVVLKIETRGAFDRLPAIMLAALERAPVGVMIARGDLAIESGYERLAELQEEMLWLCEAAHVPVIWATQVLDTLARTGRPSRAEVTDAAMAVRAECVMLNKGPFVAEALGALDDILRRMEQHQYKKRSLYRRLHLRLPAPPT
ncbi:MAG: pyruvate kinase [Proteobacteria bacterium]|nr:pyruvate kinase [Pseudomonadota bacterium]